MALDSAHPLFETTDTFQQLVDHLNRYGDIVDSDLRWLDSQIGDVNQLTTENIDDTVTKNLVSAINEIDSDIYGVGGGNFAQETLSREKTILGAINSIFDVFDPDSAGFHFDSESFHIVVSGQGQSLSLVSDSDINIIAAYDGNGGDVILSADNQIQFRHLKNRRVHLEFGTAANGKNLNTLYSNGVYEMHSKDSVILRSDANAFSLNDVVDWELDPSGKVNSTVYGDLIQNIEGTYDIVFTDGTVDNELTISRATGENIQFSLTATGHTLSSTKDFAVDVEGDITLDAEDNHIRFKNGTGGDEVTHNLDDNGTYEITAPSTYTVDVGGNIVLDADSNNILFRDGTNTRLQFTMGDTNTLSVTNNLVVDAVGDITLDAGGKDVIIEDGSTERFRFNADDAPNITMTGTAASIDNTAGDFTINAHESFVLTTNGGTKSWDIDTDTITHTGDAILDVSGDITLDAGGTDIIFRDGTANRLRFTMGSTNTLSVANDLEIDAVGDITLEGTSVTHVTDAVRLESPTDGIYGGFSNENGFLTIRSNNDSAFLSLVTEGLNLRTTRVNGMLELPARTIAGSLSLEFDAIGTRKLHDVLESLNRKIPRVYDRDGNLLNTLS